jgi:hypothetical protein
MKIRSLRNAFAPVFLNPCAFAFQRLRPTLERPMFIGIELVPQDARNAADDSRGAGVIFAGWDARQPATSSQDLDFLFIVAE